MNILSRRQRDALADRARKEHWERHSNNKTYEQWEAEQVANKPMLVKD